MKTKQWTIPLSLGLLLLAGVGYWGNQQYVARKNLENALNNKYHMAFYDMTENVQNLEVLLSKSLVGQAAEMDSVLFMEIWERSNAARANLSQLPVPDVLMGRTTKFLTQTGDYSYSLLNKMAEGKAKTEKDWQTLNQLYKQAADLNEELHNVEAKIADGSLYMSELARESKQALRKEGPKLATSNMQAIEKHMQGFPTLIYDGPFSDHVEKRVPRGVAGSRITTGQARNKAMDVIDRRDKTNYVVQGVVSQKGKIPSYRVEIMSQPVRAGEKISVALTQQGGHVVWMTNSRPVNKAVLSIEQAREKADRYLSQQGFSGMIPTYYEQQNGLAVLNYAGSQNGVIVYPDLIKVTVALDDGQIMGYEATNYLMSHYRRNLPQPELTVEQARAKLSPRLEEVSSGRLALIPTGVEKETLTYEFQGRLGSDMFLIYINALNGREEQLLRVIHNSEGILTL